MNNKRLIKIRAGGEASEYSINSMNHTIAAKNIKQNNIGISSTRVNLNEFVSGGGDVLARGSFESGGAWGDVLPLHGGAGHHMPQECLLEGLLV